MFPTAGLLVVAITAGAVLHHHDPEPHIEAPALAVPVSIPPPLPTGVTIRQIS